jgi:hypothetical protein
MKQTVNTKTGPNLIVLLIIMLILFITYNVYFFYSYPKNKNELNTLLCEKYWKPDSAIINKVYINDILLEPNEQTFKLFQNILDKTLLYDNFFFVNYSKKYNTYFLYNLDFNNNKNKYYYSVNAIEILKNASNFVMVDPYVNNQSEYSVDENQQNDLQTKIDKNSRKITSISNDNLIILEDIVIFDNNTNDKIRIVTEYNYYIVNPNDKYQKKVNELKSKFWDRGFVGMSNDF